MSKKRGLTAQEQLAADIDIEIKKEPAEALERLLIQDLEYEKEAFKPEKVTKMREFARFLLQKLKIGSLAKLQQMNPFVRRASLHFTDYGPPNGAALYFKPDKPSPGGSAASSSSGSKPSTASASGRAAAAKQKGSGKVKGDPMNIEDDDGAMATEDDAETEAQTAKQGKKAQKPTEKDKGSDKQGREGKDAKEEDASQDESQLRRTSRKGAGARASSAFAFVDSGLIPEHDQANEKPAAHLGTKPPNICEEERMYLVDILSAMPDAYNEKQSERGDVAALALGLAVREQAIVVPADVLAFFKSHPNYARSGPALMQWFKDATAAATRRKAGDLRVFGRFDFSDQLWDKLQEFGEADKGTELSDSQIAGMSAAELAEHSKTAKDKKMAADIRKREEKHKEKEREEQEYKESQKMQAQALQLLNKVLGQQLAGAPGPAQPQHAQPQHAPPQHAQAQPQPQSLPAKQKITEAFPSLTEFLAKVNASGYEAQLNADDYELSQLPDTPAEDLVASGLPRGTARRIATEAAKYLPE